MILWIGLASPLLFLLFALVIGAVTSNYSPVQDTISSLVHGNYGRWQTLNFIVFGFLTICLVYMLKDLTSTTLRNSHLITLGALTFGLSLVLLGLLPTDKPGSHTLVGQVHGIIFVITIIMQAIFQLSFALSNFQHTVFPYVIITGLITAVGLPGMFLYSDWRGLIQIILVLAIILWVTTGSLGLIYSKQT